jgi:hypothetical protein
METCEGVCTVPHINLTIIWNRVDQLCSPANVPTGTQPFVTTQQEYRNQILTWTCKEKRKSCSYLENESWLPSCRRWLSRVHLWLIFPKAVLCP